MIFFWGYLVIMNIIAFVAMGVDKEKAKKHAYRISEKMLFTFSFIGGSLGAWMGMYYFHHKTKHKKFIFGFPAIFFLHIIVVIYCLITK